jgi:hypothetical protein
MVNCNPSIKSDCKSRLVRKVHLFVEGSSDYELKKTYDTSRKEGSINVTNSWYRNDVSDPITSERVSQNSVFPLFLNRP